MPPVVVTLVLCHSRLQRSTTVLSLFISKTSQPNEGPGPIWYNDDLAKTKINVRGVGGLDSGTKSVNTGNNFEMVCLIRAENRWIATQGLLIAF
jgi:hypothetical protein